MDLFMDSLARIGVKGIKIDFMNSEAKPLIDFEMKALETAARHKLMVNFHGCQKPAGESLTFPNELTREGIRGLELNTMKEGPLPAWHNAALPFTRLVVGPGDYTPLGFSAPGPTTWAHQLATLICFYSPLQCVAEDPEFLLTDLRIKPALDFIRTVPVTWDETLVLAPSDIGKQAVMARRKENIWYIGILNGTDEQKINLNLDFLDGKKYNATCFFDDKESALIHLENLNPKGQLKEYKKAVPFKRVDQIVRQSQEIEIELAQGGGAVIQLSPVEEIKYERTK
jgi:alpha-glucosidase